MKNILIPYDFSDAAINALNYTKKLFEGQKMNIFLLDVYIGEKSYLISQERNEKWFKGIDNEIKDELEYLATILNKENKGFIYNFITDTNSLSNSVKETVEEENIDLVICGTKGAKGLTATFIGTNTIKIVNALDATPIIVVPTNYKYKSLSNILFSTNFKRRFYQKEISALLYLSALKNSLVEVVNISENTMLTEKQKTNKKHLKELTKDVKTDFIKLDWNESEMKTIQNYIEDTNDNLLVLINHKSNFFSRLLENNFIKKVVFNSTIPLLFLPEIKD